MARKKVAKYLVQCVNYNGRENVLFMMRADDCRLNDGVHVGNWTVIDRHAQYDHKARTLRTICGTMRVFNDWSVRPLFEDNAARAA